jgi:hypothetical protein
MTINRVQTAIRLGKVNVPVVHLVHATANDCRYITLPSLRMFIYQPPLIPPCGVKVKVKVKAKVKAETPTVSQTLPLDAY